LLKSSKKPPLIHQTEARLIRRYSGYEGRARTHDARAHEASFHESHFLHAELLLHFLMP